MDTQHDEMLVDKLSQVFWDHHAPAMLAYADTAEKFLSGKIPLDDDEGLKEAIRCGIRAVLTELRQHTN